jgi:hypothetical protein
MQALLCDCGQHLKAEDKEALFSQVRDHLKQEERPREHPLGQFLEEEQVRELVAGRSYDSTDVELLPIEGKDRLKEGLEPLYFYYTESKRAAVLGTRAG